jgi:hypothetical protein
MNVHGLKIPDDIVRLIENGWWPTKDNAMHQNLVCLVKSDKVRKISKDEKSIYFFPPPFRRLVKCIDNNPRFWLSSTAALREIDPFKAIDIADFGLGSDSPILLDYRKNQENPAVIYLKYSKHNKTHWMKCAESFSEFLKILDIHCNNWDQSKMSSN